jgi:hypothetical protein
MLITKGKRCSINGKKYEKQVYRVVSHCELNGYPFNTQSIDELGGSKSVNDICCNYKSDDDIGIEIKKYNSPDWMQCSIKYNIEEKKWIPSDKGKIPKECSKIFEDLINNREIFEGQVPPFIYNPITHEEWVKIKKETNKFNDFYFDIPNDTIRNLYSIKGCYYIQLSNNYGLYHLGKDICKFNVPLFELGQHIRIRTKVHSKKNSKGYCTLSVIASCQPKDIKFLKPSPYSLDDINKIPSKLKYI